MSDTEHPAPSLSGPGTAHPAPSLSGPGTAHPAPSLSGPGTAHPAPSLFGLVLLFAGAVLAGVAFGTLPWYSVSGGVDSAGDGFTFADLHANADSLGAPVAMAYFDTAAWGLLGLVVLFGVAARVFVTLSAPLRVLGFLSGVAGIVLTWYALAQLFNAQLAAGGSRHGIVHNSSSGLWCAVVGYLLAALGAVLASSTPSRAHPRGPHRPEQPRHGHPAKQSVSDARR